MSSLLEAKDLSKAFGKVTVAEGLSLSINTGEVLGVLGPNGAGKTSLFNLITGTLTPDSGTVWLSGKEITRTSAAQRARSGIARSFQVPQPFGGMTVFENAMVAATQAANLSGAKARQRSLEALEQTELLDKANLLAGKLTLLDRKRLELTRAIASGPKVLLLDEIAGGLTFRECESLINTIKGLRETGLGIIWIEHVVHALLAVVDRLMVIDFGRLIRVGEPDDVIASAEVQQVYLGLGADG